MIRHENRRRTLIAHLPGANRRGDAHDLQRLGPAAPLDGDSLADGVPAPQLRREPLIDDDAGAMLGDVIVGEVPAGAQRDAYDRQVAGHDGLLHPDRRRGIHIVTPPVPPRDLRRRERQRASGANRSDARKLADAFDRLSEERPPAIDIRKRLEIE